MKMEEKPGDGDGGGDPRAKAAPDRNNNRSPAEHANNPPGNQRSLQDTAALALHASQLASQPPTQNQGPPSLDTLAGQPLRTHRTWTPRHGRVQKCDWCNNRSIGTLQACASCILRMCETCARTRVWHRDRTHFIDADACDWTYRKAPKQARSRPPKRRAPDDDDDEEDDEPPAPTKRRRKNNDDSVQGSSSIADSGPRRHQLLAPANDTPRNTNQRSSSFYSYNEASLARQQTATHSSYAQPQRTEPALPHRHEFPAATSVPTARTRSSVRQAAARATLAMNEPSLRSRYFEDDDDEDLDDEYDNRDGNVDKKKGHAKKVNDPRRRGGNRQGEHADARPLPLTRTNRSHTPSLRAAGASASRSVVTPTPEDIAHDRIVLDIYEDLYHTRPVLDPRRVRTQIPDTWAGHMPARTPVYHHGPNAYGYDNPYLAHAQPPHGYQQLHGYQQQSHGYEQQPCGREQPHGYQQQPQRYQQQPHGYEQQPHGYSQAYGHQQPHGYEQHHGDQRMPAASMGDYHSAYNYPGQYHPQQYHPSPNYHPGNPYTPSVRNPPAYHPHNGRTAANIEHAENDDRTLQEMQRALYGNQVLTEMDGLDAIRLLWDVFELRRTYVEIRDDSRTVRFFIDEQDTQLRLRNQPNPNGDRRVQSRHQTPAAAPAPSPAQTHEQTRALATRAWVHEQSVEASREQTAPSDDNETVVEEDSDEIEEE